MNYSSLMEDTSRKHHCSTACMHESVLGPQYTSQTEYNCVSMCVCVCVCQSEIASLKADNERLQTVIAEKAGIDGAELLKQTSASAHSAAAAAAADATSG